MMRKEKLKLLANSLKYKKKMRTNLLSILFTLLIISIFIQGHEGLQVFDKISYAVLLYGSLVYFLIKKQKISYDLNMIVFCCIMIFLNGFISFVSPQYFSSLSAFKGIVSFCSFVFITFILSSNKKLVIRFWVLINNVSKFAISMILIQSILYYLFSIKLHEVPILGEWLFKAFELNSKFRPSAIFSEPSHLAEFVLLSYYYYLFIERNFRVICIYSVGLALCTSGIGIVGGLFLIILYVFMYERTERNRYGKSKKVILTITKIMLIIFTVLLFNSFYGLMLNSDNWVINRIATGGTVEARVYRSFDIFNHLKINEKIFGIGMQNQANYLNYYGIVSKYDIADTLSGREYAQTLGYILVTTGIIGFVSFLYIWIKMYFKNSFMTRVLILLFIYICLIANVLTRYIIILYMIMIYMCNRQSISDSYNCN